jgi:hypothetical protein
MRRESKSLEKEEHALPFRYAKEDMALSSSFQESLKVSKGKRLRVVFVAHKEQQA